MKNNTTFVYKMFLALSDVAAIIFSFAFAYFFRTHLDDRPYVFVSQIRDFIKLVICLAPLWLVILSVAGMYSKRVYLNRVKEYGRIFVVSVISVMSLISYEFFTGDDIFPVRIIAVYFIGISFIVLIVGRELVRFAYKLLCKIGIGRKKVIIIGDNKSSSDLVQYFLDNVSHGYDVVGVVAKDDTYPASVAKFSTIKQAVASVKPDALLQTDNTKSEQVYNFAVENHISYMFIPAQDRLLSQSSSVEIIDSYPVVDVKITNIVGKGRFIKRVCDIIFGGILLILASPVMIILTAIIKITDSSGKVFFKQPRLTRFNKEFNIYKFRTMKASLSGLTPEEAFAKLGSPELSRTYRDNGDQIENDPRITKIGKFLRATSLDELPQLINVIKGDISLVGPRALMPDEINKYPRKNLILSIKSGLTGLAQVSGRRDISFEERRRLDIYYVQNWSFWLDVQILFKTIAIVLLRRGAK